MSFLSSFFWGKRFGPNRHDAHLPAHYNPRHTPQRRALNSTRLGVAPRFARTSPRRSQGAPGIETKRWTSNQKNSRELPRETHSVYEKWSRYVRRFLLARERRAELRGPPDIAKQRQAKHAEFGFFMF